jgi:hypothetical protein
MDVKGVDPRFVESEPRAVYHVCFWSDGGRRSDEYELTNARDVREVLAWADANAGGREMEIAAVIGTTASYLVGPLDHVSGPA